MYVTLWGFGERLPFYLTVHSISLSSSPSCVKTLDWRVCFSIYLFFLSLKGQLPSIADVAPPLSNAPFNLQEEKKERGKVLDLPLDWVLGIATIKGSSDPLDISAHHILLTGTDHMK